MTNQSLAMEMMIRKVTTTISYIQNMDNLHQIPL